MNNRDCVNSRSWDERREEVWRLLHRFKLFAKSPQVRQGIILPVRVKQALVIAAALLSITVLIIVLWPTTQLINSPEISRAKRRGVLRVGVRNDVPGFAYNGEGLEIELARALCKKIFPDSDPDIMLELVPLTQFTSQARIKNGDVDIVFALQRDTGGSYAYSSPYYYDTVCVICRKEDVYTSLDQKTFAVVSSSQSNAADRLKAYCTRTDIEIFAKAFGSYPDAVDQLKNGAVDYIAAPGVFAPSILADEGVALHSQNLGGIAYVAVSGSEESSFAMLAELVIDELNTSGQLDSWIAKYGLELYRYKQ